MLNKNSLKTDSFWKIGIASFAWPWNCTFAMQSSIFRILWREVKWSERYMQYCSQGPICTVVLEYVHVYSISFEISSHKHR